MQGFVKLTALDQNISYLTLRHCAEF